VPWSQRSSSRHTFGGRTTNDYHDTTPNAPSSLNGQIVAQRYRSRRAAKRCPVRPFRAEETFQAPTEQLRQPVVGPAKRPAPAASPRCRWSTGPDMNLAIITMSKADMNDLTVARQGHGRWRASLGQLASRAAARLHPPKLQGRSEQIHGTQTRATLHTPVQRGRRCNLPPDKTVRRLLGRCWVPETATAPCWPPNSGPWWSRHRSGPGPLSAPRDRGSGRPSGRVRTRSPKARKELAPTACPGSGGAPHPFYSPRFRGGRCPP
jgi:hypothetical protein